MIPLGVDHLVVGARTLAGGVDWVHARLGMRPEKGGEHPAFGTHNALLRTGPDSYLEVLAINPDVPKPCAVYPLGLEQPEVTARLARSPYLLHWVLRVQGYDDADVIEVSRGEHRWRSVPRSDGRLPMGGVAPSLIEWLTPAPFERLPDSGLRLTALDLSTPEPDRVRAAIPGGLVPPPVSLRHGPEPALSATFSTLQGEVTL